MVVMAWMAFGCLACVFSSGSILAKHSLQTDSVANTTVIEIRISGPSEPEGTSMNPDFNSDNDVRH
jgi:hypothetical protein